MLSCLNKGKCKINRKRVDRIFSEWERQVNESEYEWKEFMGKTVLVEAAHGGNKPNIPVGQTFINFRFVLDLLSWTDAKRNCETLFGGQLFFKLDGSTKQLDDLIGRLLSPATYWIGIRREVPRLTRFCFFSFAFFCDE